MDEEELKHFRSLANTWWDETGEFEALHTMNKLRVPFIRDGILHHRDEPPQDPSQPLKGLSIVDVGSGGGLLAEVITVFVPYCTFAAYVFLKTRCDPIRNTNLIKNRQK